MRLDPLISTFQRPELLRATLASVARATRPRAMEGQFYGRYLQRDDPRRTPSPDPEV